MTMMTTTTGRKSELQAKSFFPLPFSVYLSVAFVYRHISVTSFEILQIIWCIISTFRAQQSSCFFCVIVGVNMFTRCASLHKTDISSRKQKFSFFLCCHLTSFLFDENFSSHFLRRYHVHIYSKKKNQPKSNNKTQVIHSQIKYANKKKSSQYVI